MGGARVCLGRGSMGRTLGSGREVVWSDLHHIAIPLWESGYGVWRVGRQVWKQGDPEEAVSGD